MNEVTYADFLLPSSVVTKVDLSRLVGECEAVDSELTTAAVRSQAGADSQPAPALSAQFAEFLQQNKLELTDSRTRSGLVKQLRLLKDCAPIVHMTFAVTADRDSLAQLAQWLRASVHPQAIIAVGVQPGLVAGVYLRTPNHVHDLSLRGKLEGSRDLLSRELEALRVGK